jgi:hypothetical protein
VYTGDHEERAEADAAARTAGGAPAAARGTDDPGRPRDGLAAQDPPLDFRYRASDEPLGPDAPVDYRFLYQLVLDRFEREVERGRTLDAKLAALFAGVIASIGFSFNASVSVVTAAAAVLYIVPLALISLAYTTKLEKVTPTVESLEASFPAYPVTTLVQAIKAMRIANATNVAIHDRKANVLDYAVIATIVVTMLLLGTQFGASLTHRAPAVPPPFYRAGGEIPSIAAGTVGSASAAPCRPLPCSVSSSAPRSTACGSC